MNIELGDFHLTEYVRCQKCRKKVSRDTAESEKWMTIQSLMDFFGFWIPTPKKYWCSPCTRSIQEERHHLDYWP